METGGTRVLRQVDHWVEPRRVAGSLVGTATFEVPADLDLGYHTVRAHTGGDVRRRCRSS